MKQFITAAAFILLVYAAPLAGRPELLLNYKIAVSVFFCIILFCTQPPLSLKEAEEKKKEDKFSVLFIIAASAIGQVAAIIEWGYFRPVLPSVLADLMTIAGLILLIGGTLFRIWAIRTLGKFFTATVQINKNQQLIMDGPYAFVRHPSYLGSFIAQLGSMIFLHSGIGLLITLIALGSAYFIRISAEEKVLAEAFGEQYRTYQKQSRRMIPCLW